MASPPVQRMRTLVAARLGLDIDEPRISDLEAALNRHAEAAGSTVDAYIDRVDTQAGFGAKELTTLARELTVTETYFYRNRDQLRAFADFVVTAERPLRVLSAGCASGEEPFTLAILVREAGRDATIRAVDLNTAMLEKAAGGRYGKWSLRDTSDAARDRWFRKDGDAFVLDHGIRAMVTFEERNLSRENQDLFRPDAFDVIFCRNVIMYFTPDVMRDLVGRFARALVPGGLLFLGHAETLRGLSQDFHLRHTHETFYYERRGTGDGDRPLLEDLGPVMRAPAPLPPLADTWVETIRLASERVENLVGKRAPAPPPREWDLRPALEHLAGERYAEARSLLGAMPTEAGGDPDVMILRAVLLTHGGDLADAEREARALLALDELNTGANYVLALCREARGDLVGAVHHDQVAVYLDPSFAMPRLHLGLLARRAGDDASARTELARALLLLQTEDTSRLMMFGGGFDRSALVALCRAELARAGGSA